MTKSLLLKDALLYVEVLYIRRNVARVKFYPINKFAFLKED